MNDLERDFQARREARKRVHYRPVRGCDRERCHAATLQPGGPHVHDLVVEIGPDDLGIEGVVSEDGRTTYVKLVQWDVNLTPWRTPPCAYPTPGSYHYAEDCPSCAKPPNG